jgi:hypothetical protein
MLFPSRRGNSAHQLALEPIRVRAFELIAPAGYLVPFQTARTSARPVSVRVLSVVRMTLVAQRHFLEIIYQTKCYVIALRLPACLARYFD